MLHNTAVPFRGMITGTYALGQVLTALPPGGLVPSGWQWYRSLNGAAPTPISGASNQTYTVSAADIPSSGNTITITVELSSVTFMSVGISKTTP